MPINGPRIDRPFHLPTLLQRGLDLTPDEPALVSLETRWSWRELDQAAQRIAANLLSLGL